MSKFSRKKKKEKRIRLPAEYTEGTLSFKTGPGKKPLLSERAREVSLLLNESYYDKIVSANADMHHG